VISNLARVQILSEAQVEELEAERRQPRPMQFQHAEAESAVTEAPTAAAAPAAALPPGRPLVPQAPAAPAPDTFVRELPKVGRNDLCPCGSGKKYKQCHGRLA